MATLTAMRQPMRADGNADATRQSMMVDGNADGNAQAKNGRNKTETEERKAMIEKRETGEKPVTIGVALAASYFYHLLCYIVKYV